MFIGVHMQEKSEKQVCVSRKSLRSFSKNETKVELFGLNGRCFVWREGKAAL